MKKLRILGRRLTAARNTGKWVPLELRLEIAAEAIRCREEAGMSRRRFADELGMSRATLSSWVDRLRQREVPQEDSKTLTSKIRPVVVGQPAMPSAGLAARLSVRLSSGAVVTGLSIAEIATLERALS